MWFKFFIFSTLFNLSLATPPGSRENTSDKSNQKNWISRDDKRNQPSTSSSYLSNFHFGSEPQRTPLDLSIKNRQISQYAPPSTSGAKNKLFHCSQCDKSYTSTGNLNKHMDNKHKGKTFDCTKCGQQYATKQGLERHDQSFHQGKTFDCTKCGQQYASKQGLESHDQSYHQGKTFDCTKCGRKYTRKRCLEDHDRAEHQENSEIFKCERCPFQTRHRGSFYDHKSKYH